jgi:hypothetical protein
VVEDITDLVAVLVEYLTVVVAVVL